jgi:pantothenate kinase type III
VGSVAGEWRDFPLDTGSAVESGIALALLGVVRGMRERLVGFRVSGRAASGMPAGHAAGQLPRVLLTGGARACLRPLLDGEVFEVDDLVIEGLAWIARDLGYAG